VLVSTPQEVAILDVKKAASMFYKMNIPIIGLVENMAYFVDETTGQKTYIFGEGKVDKFCAENNITKLCEIPIHPEISKICDEGLQGKNMVSKILKQINSKL
jgi:ATP-binding protein involved in chromosome partitioning